MGEAGKLRIVRRAWLKIAAPAFAGCLVVALLVSQGATAASTRGNGYWIASGGGTVGAFGDGTSQGALDRFAFSGQIVDISARPTGKGYWLLGRDGSVYPFGDAVSYGQLDAKNAKGGAAALLVSPSGAGYLIVTTQGEAHAFGDAGSYGSLAPDTTPKQIVGAAATASGNGYLLLDSAGEVFGFGDATVFGGVPPLPRSHPVVAIATRAHGSGYWIVSKFGVVTPFGGAPSLGSIDESAYRGPIVDIAATHTGNGYWLVAQDGTVLAFGDAVLYGNATVGFKGPIAAIAATPFVNHAPVAVTDVVTLDEDTVVDVNVVANDTDEDGDPLTASVVTQPAHGLATLNAGGTIRYQPAPNYNGSDSFTYRIEDGWGGAAIGTVNITVVPVNDRPIALDDAYTTLEDTPLSVAAPGVIVNDSDVDGDALSAIVLASPSHGTLVLASGGAFTYTPAANFHGSDTFSYQVDDGHGGSAAAYVRLTIVSVLDTPMAVGESFTTNEDVMLTVAPPGVLANDNDGDGDALSAILVGPPAHGTLALAPDGSLTYTPDPNYHGDDGFSYRATDGTLSSAPATVAITVVSVNDAPSAAADTYATDEDTPLEVTAAAGVLANDSDVDGDALSAQLVTSVSHGTLTLAADGSFSYAPAAGYSGPDGFSYQASDGTLTSAVTSVSIEIAPVDDAPVATADAYTVDEDTLLAIAAPGVLGNDLDDGAEPLRVTLVDRPSHGEVRLEADGSFEYMPEANFNGMDGFSYLASDGTLESAVTQVVITVVAIADVPTAQSDSYSVIAGATLTIAAPGVLSNDFAEGALTAELVMSTEHGTLTLNPDGSFTYTTNLTTSGSDSFLYDAVSGGVHSDTATVFISVIAPGGGGGGGGSGGMGNPTIAIYDVDTFNTKMGGSVGLQPRYGRLEIRYGSWVYVPQRGFRGHDTFSVGSRRFEIDVLSDIWGD
jgi:VCBS repeat-containing protein